MKHFTKKHFEKWPGCIPPPNPNIKKSATWEHLTRHTLSLPQKNCAKHSTVTTHPDERSPHLSGEHSGKRANTCEKLSVYYGNNIQTLPPQRRPSCSLSVPPGPCRNTLPIPRDQVASRGEFTCPSLTKEWDYGCKTAPPFLQPLLPDSRLPENPLLSWGPLVLRRQLRPPERACARSAGDEGTRHNACEAAAAAVPL